MCVTLFRPHAVYSPRTEEEVMPFIKRSTKRVMSKDYTAKEAKDTPHLVEARYMEGQQKIEVDQY